MGVEEENRQRHIASVSLPFSQPELMNCLVCCLRNVSMSNGDAWLTATFSSATGLLRARNFLCVMLHAAGMVAVSHPWCAHRDETCIARAGAAREWLAVLNSVTVLVLTGIVAMLLPLEQP